MSRKVIIGAGVLLGVVAFLAFGMGNRANASTTLVVYKTPTCGCCGSWIEHMEEAGYEVKVIDLEDLRPIKDKEGVSPRLRSCHTAMIGGYVIEGHVPAEQVTRMLAEKPNLRGIAVPGMPIGSPGMEQGDPANYQDYQVVAFDAEGNLSVYADIKAGS